MSYPDFDPRLYTQGGVAFYDDGRVLAAVDVIGNDLVICEWTSRFRGQGFTVVALEWFRSRGFTTIVAQGVGLIEDDVADESTRYWQRLQSKELVDVLIDDLGEELVPVGQSPSPRHESPENSTRVKHPACSHTSTEPSV